MGLVGLAGGEISSMHVPDCQLLTLMVETFHHAARIAMLKQPTVHRPAFSPTYRFHEDPFQHVEPFILYTNDPASR